MFSELLDGAWQHAARPIPSSSIDVQCDATARLAARHAPDSPEARSAAVTEPDVVTAPVHEAFCRPPDALPSSLPPSSTRAISARRPLLEGANRALEDSAATEPPPAQPAARQWPPVTTAYAALRAVAPPPRDLHLLSFRGGSGGLHSGSLAPAATDLRQPGAALSSRSAGGGPISMQPWTGYTLSARNDLPGSSLRAVSSDAALQSAAAAPAALGAADDASHAGAWRDQETGSKDAARYVTMRSAR